MDFFIIKWELFEKEDEETTLLGFSNDGNCLRVIGFKPYIYVEVEDCESSSYKFIRGNKKASVRKEYLNNNKEVRKYKKIIYEDDIPIITKFLSEKGIDRVGWVRVNKFHILPHQNSISNEKEYLVNQNNIENINHIKCEIPDIKVLAFDIECYSKYRGMSDARNEEDVIFMISMIFFTNDEINSFVLAVDKSKDNNNIKNKKFTYEQYDDEFTMLKSFFDKIKEHNPSVITGYNILEFDMRYIRDKYYSMLINIPHGGRCKEECIRDEIISRTWTSSAYGIVDTTIFNFTGRCCVDIYRYLKMEVPLQKYSLDFVSNYYLNEGKVDMPYETMFRMYEKGKIKELTNYCYVDSLLTVKLWKKFQLWYAVVEGSRIFCIDAHELYSRGQQNKIFSQIYHYTHNKNYVFDRKKILEEDFTYSGAYVVSPETGIYNNCAVVDFASLYPSIIISENICYTTYDENTSTFTKEREGVIPLILRHLIEERKKVNIMMKDEKNPSMKALYNKRQVTYKIAANSFYGAFGSRNSYYLQLVDGASKITETGRNLLKQAIDLINNYHIKCKVIYGDTDSCFFIGEEKDLTIEEVNEIVKQVNKSFPSPVRLEFEKMMDKIFLLAKKKYIYSIKGNISSKGVITAKRDSCSWSREIYEEIIFMILNNKNNEEVNEFIMKEFINILQGGVIMNKLFINRNLGRNYKLENYPLRIFSKVLAEGEDRQVHPGERLEYYFIKSSHIYQGYKMASKSMIEKYNLQLDFRYYIDHQIKSPLTQIYGALGWRFKN